LIRNSCTRRELTLKMQKSLVIWKIQKKVVNLIKGSIYEHCARPIKETVKECICSLVFSFE